MGADQAGLSPSQRIRLEQLAARLVLAEGFRPDDAVGTAAELVAEGIDVEGVVQLASQPSDGNFLAVDEVKALLRAALAEVGIETPSRSAAAWTLARLYATSMVDDVIPPEEGARRLWSLASDCGNPRELGWMLQLHDAWESSIGPDRDAVEAEMLAFAPEVIYRRRSLPRRPVMWMSASCRREVGSRTRSSRGSCCANPRCCGCAH